MKLKLITNVDKDLYNNLCRIIKEVIQENNMSVFPIRCEDGFYVDSILNQHEINLLMKRTKGWITIVQ